MWRCISYGKFRFSIAMLVYWGVTFIYKLIIKLKWCHMDGNPPNASTTVRTWQTKIRFVAGSVLCLLSKPRPATYSTYYKYVILVCIWKKCFVCVCAFDSVLPYVMFTITCNCRSTIINVYIYIYIIIYIYSFQIVSYISLMIWLHSWEWNSVGRFPGSCATEQQWHQSEGIWIGAPFFWDTILQNVF